MRMASVESGVAGSRIFSSSSLPAPLHHTARTTAMSGNWKRRRLAQMLSGVLLWSTVIVCAPLLTARIGSKIQYIIYLGLSMAGLKWQG